MNKAIGYLICAGLILSDIWRRKPEPAVKLERRSVLCNCGCGKFFCDGYDGGINWSSRGM